MAPRRKKAEESSGQEGEVLSKEDEAIAKFIRFNTPTETSMFQGNEVHYFSGAKAVDTLFESKYGSKAKGEPKFADRRAALRFLEYLFERRLFWRARKLVPKKKEDKEKENKKKITDEASDVNSTPRPKKTKKKGSDDGNESVSETLEKKEENKEKEEKEEKDAKKKKKVKLEVHNVQSFNDANDVYVWVFDPTPLHKKIIGMLMVVGTIVGCLFPLWPMWLRQGVYYLSLAGIGAFGAIVVTAILRTILFGLIWLATVGRHHLWILPNLTEDCGFFESFQPWYTYEFRPDGKAPPKDDKKKKKKEKDSDDDKEDDKEEEAAKANEDAKETEEKGEKVEGEDRISAEESGEDEQSLSSVSDSEGGTGSSSVSASGAAGDSEKPKVRRRVRRADDDFVVVDK